jgi:hypothetical protein
VGLGKLFKPPIPTSMCQLLHGEAAAFVEIWRQLEGPAANVSARFHSLCFATTSCKRHDG